MSDCIFCKIAAGEIPSTKVYEDDNFKFVFNKFSVISHKNTLFLIFNLILKKCARTS